jgi:hypothetical protein
MRVFCAPAGVAADTPMDLRYVLYSHPTDQAVGAIGSSILPIVKRRELRPTSRAWDFLSIALAVIGADEGSSRTLTADGWAREIDLTVAVSDPTFWTRQSGNFASALRFLTTDRWNFTFIPNGFRPAPSRKLVSRPENIVCLLSGGLDSLVGALDLRASGRRPLLVSQVSQGDKKSQKFFAHAIAGNYLHLQLNHYASPPPGYSERSQRARSLIFIAYGILAAASLDCYHEGECVDLVIPENGFISINIPLTPLRLASHSTRTTHPYFITSIQRLLDEAKLRICLVNPYQLMTKGEMLAACRDQVFLIRYASKTTSCARYARNAFKHCGRCVPCLIRRAAFERWAQHDHTAYRYQNIAKPGRRYRDFDDVRSTSMAIETVRTFGLDSWIGGALNTAQLGDVGPYRELAGRGIAELHAFMTAAGVM